MNKIKAALHAAINNSLLFFSLSIGLSLAILLNTDSIVFYAFKYMLMPISIFFHEASHGLMAFALNLEVTGLQMRWFSGYVTSSYLVGLEETKSAMVAFAGYAGTTLFGLLIFLASIRLKLCLVGLIMAICVVFSFYSIDLKTVGVMLYIMAVFGLCFFDFKPINYILRFIGAYLMVSSVQSPLHQLGNTGHSDSTNLVKYFGINEHFYVGLWVSFSVIVIGLSFFTLWKIEKRRRALIMATAS